MKLYSKTKHVEKQGFKTPDFWRTAVLGNKPTVPKFTQKSFKTQHKG